MDGSIATCRRSAIGWTLAAEATSRFLTSWAQSSGVVGGVFQPEDSGWAMTAWSWGLTVVGTGMDFAGTSRGASGGVGVWVCADAAGASRRVAAVKALVRCGRLMRFSPGVSGACQGGEAVPPYSTGLQHPFGVPFGGIVVPGQRGREDRGDVGHAGVVGRAPFELGFRFDGGAEDWFDARFGVVGEGEKCLTGETGAAEEDADLGVWKFRSIQGDPCGVADDGEATVAVASGGVGWECGAMVGRRARRPRQKARSWARSAGVRVRCGG